jgi:hypothetical protein
MKAMRNLGSWSKKFLKINWRRNRTTTTKKVGRSFLAGASPFRS